MLTIWSRDLNGKALETQAGQRFKQKYDLAKMSASDVKVEITDDMQKVVRLNAQVHTPKTVRPFSKKRAKSKVNRSKIFGYLFSKTGKRGAHSKKALPKKRKASGRKDAPKSHPNTGAIYRACESCGQHFLRLTEKSGFWRWYDNHKNGCKIVPL